MVATVGLSFEQPWWLAAISLAAAPIALALAGRKRRRGSHAQAGGVALQSAAIALLAAALARPLALVPGGALPVLVLQDASASVRGQAALARAPRGPWEQYDFADGVWPHGAPAAVSLDATDVASALQLAAWRAGDVSAVILRTDGRFTSDPQSAARALAASGVAVAVVPMDAAPADARVRLEARRTQGDDVELTVSVASSGRQRRTLLVGHREGAPLASRTLDLLEGDNVTLRLADRLPADAAGWYRARFAEADEFPENDSAVAAVWPSRKAALVVGAVDSPLPMGTRARRVGPADMPPSAQELTRYTCVVLIGPAATLLSPAQRQALEQYVQSGGGLIVVGAGPHASPADRDDPLNRVLPLVANPYQRQPLKVIVVLDRSGSMGEPPPPAPHSRRQTRFEMASQAVLALRSHLTPKDALAVVAFAEEPKVLYDSGNDAPDFGPLREALLSVNPAGSTKAQPALGRALDLAAGERRALVILVSDLLSQPFDPEPLAERFRRARADLAVVAISSSGSMEAAQPLEALAGALGSPMVRDDDLEGLADVFGRFVTRSRGEPVLHGRFAVAPADVGPEVTAYYPSALAAEAQALAHVQGDVLLAAGRHGLGRAMVLAISLAEGENDAWRRELPRFLEAAVARTSAPEHDGRFEVELEQSRQRLRVVVRANDDAGPMNMLPLHAAVGPSAPVALRQVAPGEYRLEAMLPSGTAVGVEVTLGDAAVWQGVAGAGYAHEFDATGADMQSLRALADAAGGKVLSPRELPALDAQRLRSRQVAIWPWLLAAALAAALVDWGTTRLTLTRQGASPRTANSE
jgi:hypothetical protein